MVFDRDRNGEAQELASRLKRIDDQIADLRRGIEQDVRAALLNLESTAQQVAVAQQGQDLAERELKVTRDRFGSGVTNNIEVMTAQDELRGRRRTTSSPFRPMWTRSLLWRAPPAAPRKTSINILGIRSGGGWDLATKPVREV